MNRFHPDVAILLTVKDSDVINSVTKVLYPSVSFADSVSLRLGRATALTALRAVIYYRVDATRPPGGSLAVKPTNTVKVQLIADKTRCNRL